jgi:hypothetical protein
MSMTTTETTFTDSQADKQVSFAPAAILPLLSLCIFSLLGLCLSLWLFSGPQGADIAAAMQILG